MSDNDIQKVVQHHDGQIQTLNNRVGHVEKTQAEHTTILNVIRDAVTKHDAQPRFDIRYVLDITKNFGVIFAMVCGGILYLASRNVETELAVIKKDNDMAGHRLERMESLILPENWASKVERRK